MDKQSPFYCALAALCVWRAPSSCSPGKVLLALG